MNDKRIIFTYAKFLLLLFVISSTLTNCKNNSEDKLATVEEQDRKKISEHTATVNKIIEDTVSQINAGDLEKAGLEIREILNHPISKAESIAEATSLFNQLEKANSKTFNRDFLDGISDNQWYKFSTNETIYYKGTFENQEINDQFFRGLSKQFSHLDKIRYSPRAEVYNSRKSSISSDTYLSSDIFSDDVVSKFLEMDGIPATLYTIKKWRDGYEKGANSPERFK